MGPTTTASAHLSTTQSQTPFSGLLLLLLLTTKNVPLRNDSRRSDGKSLRWRNTIINYSTLKIFTRPFATAVASEAGGFFSTVYVPRMSLAELPPVWHSESFSCLAELRFILSHTPNLDFTGLFSEVCCHIFIMLLCFNENLLSKLPSRKMPYPS